MKKCKVVMAGCGRMSGAWLKPSVEFNDIDIVALVDLNIENAKVAQREFNLHNAVVSDNLENLLNGIEADIVFDCTVPSAHTEVTLTAIRHGCHVLGEKPMADSMDKARTMVSTASKANKLYAVLQNYRYQQGIRKLQNFIRTGSIGEITTLNADFYLGPHFGGFREEMEHVLLLDMSIHTFDMARFISGSNALTVYCHEWNPLNSWFKHGASAAAIFEMTSGVVFNYRGSWCAEGLSTPWNAFWRITGTKGSVIRDGADEFKAEIVEDGKTHSIKVPDIPELEYVGHAAIIREFVDCVKNGGTPDTICTDNIKSLAMVHSAIKSAEKQIPVIIRDI